MPARAANPAHGDHPPTPAPTPQQTGHAVVVDLASRRRTAGTRAAGDNDARPPQTPNPAADLTQAQRAALHWAGVLDAAGLDLANDTVAATVQVVASGLERLAGGMLVMREGGGPRNVEPNPWRGLDRVGAEELCALLRELHTSPDVVRDAQARVPQQGR